MIPATKEEVAALQLDLLGKQISRLESAIAARQGSADSSAIFTHYLRILGELEGERRQIHGGPVVRAVSPHRSPSPCAGHTRCRTWHKGKHLGDPALRAAILAEGNELEELPDMDCTKKRLWDGTRKTTSALAWDLLDA